MNPTPNPPPPDDAAAPRHSRAWWILRGLEVRLRFFVLIGLAAALVAGWPWLRGAWERIASRHSHPPSGAVAGDSEFFCPMDPGVVSTWPAICPICNMDLVPRKKHDAVILPEGVVARMQFSPYRVQLAGIRTVAVERRNLEHAAPSALATEAGVAVVPASSVLDRDGDRIVYVETMPGLFDGVRVQLGRRSGDVYPVLDGVWPGQRVVAMGAFLIDAESRLNPNVATQYFGANSQVAGRSEPHPLPAAKSEKRAKGPVLSKQDRELADRQRLCPVTELSLGSMGEPILVTVKGRKVFLCCRGCEKAITTNPEKYLQRLDPSGKP